MHGKHEKCTGLD